LAFRKRLKASRTSASVHGFVFLVALRAGRDPATAFPADFFALGDAATGTLDFRAR
jgi:hypothetical protein